MVDPVEEQINLMIDGVDAAIAGKYPFTLRDLIEHPLDYRDRPTILVEIENLKADIADYFAKRKMGVTEVMSTYMKDAAKAEEVAKQFEKVINSAAKSAKKPIVSPIVFVRKEDEDEILFVNKFDEDTSPKLIDALVSNCLFVVDASMEVDGFKVGRWVFPDPSGKNRAIYVSFPINPAGALDIARDQMLLALDVIKSEIMNQLALEGRPMPISPAPAAPVPAKGAESKPPESKPPASGGTNKK